MGRVGRCFGRGPSLGSGWFIVGMAAVALPAAFLFFVLPWWALVDCARSIGARRTRVAWTIALVLLWGPSALLYGLLAARSRRMRRVTWVAMVVIGVGAFVALRAMDDAGHARGGGTLATLRRGTRPALKVLPRPKGQRAPTALGVRDEDRGAPLALWFESPPVATLPLAPDASATSAGKPGASTSSNGGQAAAASASGDELASEPEAPLPRLVVVRASGLGQVGSRPVPPRLVLAAGQAGDAAYYGATRFEIGRVATIVGSFTDLSPQRRLTGFAWPVGITWDAMRSRLVVLARANGGDLAAYEPATGRWTRLARVGTIHASALLALAHVPPRDELVALRVAAERHLATALVRFGPDGRALGERTLTPPLPLPLPVNDAVVQLSFQGGVLVALVSGPSGPKGHWRNAAFLIDPTSGTTRGDGAK